MKEYELLVVGKITPRTLQTLTREYTGVPRAAFFLPNTSSHIKFHAYQSSDNELINLFTREETNTTNGLGRAASEEQQVSLDIIESRLVISSVCWWEERRVLLFISCPAAALRSNFQAASVWLFRRSQARPGQAGEQTTPGPALSEPSVSLVFVFCHNDRFHHW